MNNIFDPGSPASAFAAVAAGSAVKFLAGFLLHRQKSTAKKYRLVGTVGELWIFPVKSLRGISVQKAEIGRLGLEFKGVGDRQWVVTNSDGNFLCQRRYPSMVLIEPTLKGNEIELKAPGMEPVCFPIAPQLTSSNLSKAIVWDEDTPSLDVGDKVGNWLSRYFNIDGLRLHFSEPSLKKRDLSKSKSNKPWGNLALEGDECAYADFCGYLVLSKESVDFLNTKLQNPVPISNFRPNIVVYGCDAFAEDDWKSIQIGDARIRALDACTRCIMPTVNQSTGVKDKDGEPLATLRKFRRKEPYGKKPVFGMNYTFSQSGAIHVGDPVYALDG